MITHGGNKVKQELGARRALSTVLYAVAALVFAALGLLAMYVAYQILGSNFWTSVLGHSLFEAPPALFDVSLIKIFEVIAGVLTVHAVLKFGGVYRRDPTGPTVFALLVLAFASVGFLVTYNNAGFAGSGVSYGDRIPLLFAGVVFFVVAALAALYLQLAEKYFFKSLR